MDVDIYPHLRKSATKSTTRGTQDRNYNNMFHTSIREDYHKTVTGVVILSICL